MGSERNNNLRRWPDGVDTQPASQEVLEGYQKVRTQLAQFQAPLLVGAAKPHGRVFVAAFDGTGTGTGNDKDKDKDKDKLKLPDEKTNVGTP